MRRWTAVGSAAVLLSLLSLLSLAGPPTMAEPAPRVVGQTEDHDLAFTSSDRTTLQVLDTASGQTTHVFSSTSSIQSVAVAPGGARVAWLFYANEPIASNRILVARVGADDPPRNVLSRHRRQFDWIDVVSWSPDGRRLAFVASDAATERLDLWSIRRDGRGLRRLVRQPGSCPDNCGRLVWSPDGSRIAWYAEGRGWRAVALRSGRVTRLPARFIGWTSSGRRVVSALGFFDSDKRLVTMRPDGSDKSLVLRDVPLSGSGPFAAVVGTHDTVMLLWETPENDDPEPYTRIDLADGSRHEVLVDPDGDTGDAFDWR